MDDKKFCFIMCANQKELADECLLYIEQLHVPDGFSVETKVIYNAKSMASGYNRAMRESDAKYKIYLHQDVLLIYRDILSKILEIFTAHQKIGLLGVVGNSSLEEDGCPWSGETERRIGGLRVDVVTHKENVVFAPVIGAYQAAVVLDGLFLATQYDVPWREDLFQGWDFYDCSQSLEFWRAGYQVVVPHMETPWCLHDNDIQNMEHYEQWRCIFEKEYAEDYLNWVDGKFIQRPKIIYQKFTGKNPAQPVPYPPIYREKEVQYICFTDNAQVTSKTWDIRYVKNLDELKIETELPKNSRTFELFENQIQIGAVFEKNEEYTSVITVPSFSELPYMIFEPDKIVPTADENGRYKHRRNPVYTGGAYGGRSLLLTIGVPVSNQIDTIERCLSHMKPLLDELDSELLVIDTGSTDGTLDICRRYGARIVSYPWCDNMSAVRNEGLYQAKGLWYLSADDDEWFEDVDDILRFFKKGIYRKCDSATYIQRNYFQSFGGAYEDNHTFRMVRITPEMHFEGRIHDALVVPTKSVNYQLFSYVHHYGFVHDNEQQLQEKYIRNTRILLQDVYEYPGNLRYNFQLANELKCKSYVKEAEAYFFRGIALTQEFTRENNYFGKLHVVDLLAIYYDMRNPIIFAMTELLQDCFRLTFAERAFLNFNRASLALRFHKPADEILHYYDCYEHEKECYQKNPRDSQINSYIGLRACERKEQIIDGYAIAFCALVQKGEEREAIAKMEQIEPTHMLDQRRNFFEYAVAASDCVYEKFIEMFSVQDWEQWREELLDAFLISICEDEITERQFARLPAFFEKFSIKTLEWYLEQFYVQFVEQMKEKLYIYAMKRKAEECTVQELYFCAYILKMKYLETGKQEKDRELFSQYVCMTAVYCKNYYHPNILEQQEKGVLSADLYAVYNIYQAMQENADTHQRIMYLKEALRVFPGFKSEIQYLLEQFTKPKQETAEDEMARLAGQLKAQTKELIRQGKINQAEEILQELASYCPNDVEIEELLVLAKEEIIVRG